MWVAAETQRRPRPRVVFFSRQGEESERSGVTGGSGVTLSLGEGDRQREVPRQCDLTESPVTKNWSDTCTTRERANVPDMRADTAQAAHAQGQPHAHPRFHSLTHSLTHSRCFMCHSATRHKQHRNRVCVRAQPLRFDALVAPASVSAGEAFLCPSALPPRGTHNVV